MRRCDISEDLRLGLDPVLSAEGSSYERRPTGDIRNFLNAIGASNRRSMAVLSEEYSSWKNYIPASGDGRKEDI